MEMRRQVIYSYPFANTIYVKSNNEFQYKQYKLNVARLSKGGALTASSLNSQASTLSPLHPWYVSGFVDGEGSFTISITKNKRKTEGWRIGARFAVEISKSDALLLYRLKSYFGVGTIIECRILLQRIWEHL